jgi:hypothetical protein
MIYCTTKLIKLQFRAGTMAAKTIRVDDTEVVVASIGYTALM